MGDCQKLAHDFAGILGKEVGIVPMGSRARLRNHFVNIYVKTPHQEEPAERIDQKQQEVYENEMRNHRNQQGEEAVE
jgi:hypothetical protein